MKKKILIAVCIILPAFILSIIFLNITDDPGISYDKNVILDNEEAYTSIAKLCYED